MQLHGNCTSKRSSCTSISDDKLDTSGSSSCSTDKDAGIILCRVCQCSESDIRGDVALELLNIVPPSQELSEISMNGNFNDKLTTKCSVEGVVSKENSQKGGEVVQFVSPEGEKFVCRTDVESGSYLNQDAIFNLGCSCRDDLAYAHYALKRFTTRGCTVCEICEFVAKNVRITDLRKIMASLKEFEELRNRTATGEPAYVNMEVNSGVDPDAIAAIRRQRLIEVSLWFNLQNNSTTFSPETVEELPRSPTEIAAPVVIVVDKSALEFTGMLIIICLTLVILLWFIAPRAGKKAAFVGFYFLLADLCALAVLIFLRVAVPTRFMHGPTRYWAILFIFCFLAFMVWPSRTQCSCSVIMTRNSRRPRTLACVSHVLACVSHVLDFDLLS